jgi:hypothetical protein
MRYLALTLFLTLLIFPTLYGQEYIYDIHDVDRVEGEENQQVDVTSHLDLSYDINSIVAWDSMDEQIIIYNTGLDLTLKHDSGLSLDLATAVDGPIGEINSKNFKVETFIKELKANYEFETERAVILLSVGKMPTGSKVNQNDPKNIDGVMGIRVSLSPKKIPLIQEWLDRNELRVSKIEVTRYNSESSDRLWINDLEQSDMTAYALHLSWKHRLHTFFIYKRPDESSHAPEGITVGAAYSLSLPMNPQIFVLNHSSRASYMDLNVLVLSASVEVAEDTRVSLAWSSARERMSGSKKETIDLAGKRKIGTLFGRETYVKVGVKEERNHQNGERDLIYYFQFELN